MTGASRFSRWAIQALRVAVLTVEGFLDDLCLLRASALTYASLMALVPVLAISFAVLRGLGWRGARLETLILEKLTILSPEAISTVVSYIDNTSLTGLGIFGGILLLAIFLSLMSNIEHSFNAIWGSPPPRSWLRKASDYLGLSVAAPLLLASATSITAALRRDAFVQSLEATWGLGGLLEASMAMAAHVLVWLLFAFLYMFVPNTKVRLFPAVLGAVVAGSIWELTQAAYINFQIGVANYNAIYGAMAQLPVLMAWVYVSWVIVLLGAELVAAVQNLGFYSHERRTAKSGYALRERLGLSICAELARAAHACSPTPTVEDLAHKLDAPVKNIREIVNDMIAGGLLHFGGEDGELCFLSLAPSRIQVSRVLDLLRGADQLALQADAGAGTAKVADLCEQLDSHRMQAVSGATIADLASETS